MICSGAEPFFLPGGPQGVLLVHGFTGSPADLLLLGRFLQARGCTVLGVRLAGHATSEEDLSRQTAEDWLDSVRDGAALLRGCTQTLSVVGH
ncbi:MAG: carboxylesterase, partial [Selenomonas sp.]|nr:carboxylesterase [Selenomonas sp.]